MLCTEGLKNELFVSLIAERFKGVSTQLLAMLMMLLFFKGLDSFYDLDMSLSLSLVIDKLMSYFLTYSS